MIIVRKWRKLLWTYNKNEVVKKPLVESYYFKYFLSISFKINVTLLKNLRKNCISKINSFIKFLDLKRDKRDTQNETIFGNYSRFILKFQWNLNT